MKHFLMAILLVIPYLCQGQKIIKDETDRFTKRRVVETSWVRLGTKFTSYVDGQIYIDGNDTLLRLKIIDNQAFKFEKGDTSYVLLENNKSLKFIAKDAEYPGLNSSQAGSAWSGIFAFNISGEQIKSLSKIEAIAIRLGTANNVRDFDIKERNSFKFQRMLNLLNP